jgi:hypothetical protein
MQHSPAAKPHAAVKPHAAAKPHASVAHNRAANLRMGWLRPGTRVILETSATTCSTRGSCAAGTFATPHAPGRTTREKIGIVMLVTALLAPIDQRRKILLLTIFAFIVLC